MSRVSSVCGSSQFQGQFQALRERERAVSRIEPPPPPLQGARRMEKEQTEK